MLKVMCILENFTLKEKHITVKWKHMSLLNGNKSYRKLLSNQDERLVSHNALINFLYLLKVAFLDVFKDTCNLNYKRFKH